MKDHPAGPVWVNSPTWGQVERLPSAGTARPDDERDLRALVDRSGSVGDDRAVERERHTVVAGGDGAETAVGIEFDDDTGTTVVRHTPNRTGAAGHRLSAVILHELEQVLRDRRTADPETSYTARLLADPVLVQRKIMEEAFEVCLELQAEPAAPSTTASEAADLVYHLLVGLVGAGVDVDAVLAELERRRS